MEYSWSMFVQQQLQRFVFNWMEFLINKKKIEKKNETKQKQKQKIHEKNNQRSTMKMTKTSKKASSKNPAQLQDLEEEKRIWKRKGERTGSHTGMWEKKKQRRGGNFLKVFPSFLNSSELHQDVIRKYHKIQLHFRISKRNRKPEDRKKSWKFYFDFIPGFFFQRFATIKFNFSKDFPRSSSISPKIFQISGFGGGEKESEKAGSSRSLSWTHFFFFLWLPSGSFNDVPSIGLWFNLQFQTIQEPILILLSSLGPKEHFA